MHRSRSSAFVSDYTETLSTFAQQPRAVTLNNGIRPAPIHTFSLVACARWEKNYIVEWIEYHRSIGFDHVYLYCNDDDPRELYETIMPYLSGPDPLVTFVHYPYIGGQSQMYFDFLWRFSTETRFLMFLDVDEFLCLRNVDDIAAFMEEFSDYDAVYFNWVHFGHNGHKERPPGNVLTQYTRRESEADPHTKVLIRSERVPYAASFSRLEHPIHHDYAQIDTTLLTCNVFKYDMRGYYNDFPQSARDLIATDGLSTRLLDKAFIAHFNIKSEADFDLRARRSLAGNFLKQHNWADMSAESRTAFLAATNAVEDAYLSHYWAARIDRALRTTLFPPTRWPLLSKHKEATQSSVYANHTAEVDAARLLTDQLSGQPANHTQQERNPWWSVDLGAAHTLHEVRVFNRLSPPLDRNRNFKIESSLDGLVWYAVHIKNDDQLYGGMDGTPYIWTDLTGFRGRYVRIVILGHTFLHFDHIEIYGT